MAPSPTTVSTRWTSGPISAWLADHARPLQDHPGQQHHVRLQRHVHVDVGPLRVPHGHAPTHPPLVDPVAQLGLGHGQLGPVVDPGHLHGVLDHHRAHLVAGLVEHPDHVGQVVLPLGVGRAEPPQRRGQHAPPEAVDRGVDLAHLELLVGGVAVLDHPGHRVVPAPHHPSVPGGVGELRGQQGGGGVRTPGAGATSAARVAGRSSGVSPGRTTTSPSSLPTSSGSPVSATDMASPGPPLLHLLDELDGHARRGVLDQRLGHPLGPVADHHDHPAHRAARPARRARGGPWVGRTAGGGAWAGPSASGSPRRRPAPPPTAADRGPPRPAGRPRRRPRPRTRRPTRPPAPGGRSGSPPAGPASDGPRTSAPSVTRCTGHGPILPTSAASDATRSPNHQTTPGNRRHSRQSPPHPTMPVLATTIDPNSDTFRANARALSDGLDTVNEQLAAARAGGGERYVQRHRERGKLPARERIELLLDRDTAFLELCALAAWGTEYQVGASSDHRHRRGRGGRVPDRRPRPHRAGRRHEPLLLPQGRPCLGHRPRRTACRSSTWSSRAGPTSRPRPSCSSPGAAPSGTSPAARPRPCPPWPWSSATPPPAAPTSRA